MSVGPLALQLHHELLDLQRQFSVPLFEERVEELLVVHGIGTGSLRRAVREYLRASRYVSDIESAGSDAAGDGATLALLR